MAEMRDINGGVRRLICHRKQGKRKKRYKEDKEGGKVKKKKKGAIQEVPHVKNGSLLGNLLRKQKKVTHEIIQGNFPALKRRLKVPLGAKHNG